MSGFAELRGSFLVRVPCILSHFAKETDHEAWDGTSGLVRVPSHWDSICEWTGDDQGNVRGERGRGDEARAENAGSHRHYVPGIRISVRDYCESRECAAERRGRWRNR